MAAETEPRNAVVGIGNDRGPAGNSPIFRRLGVISAPKRARISASASGCSWSSTPAARAAH